jgi:hypothetical protein
MARIARKLPRKKLSLLKIKNNYINNHKEILFMFRPKKNIVRYVAFSTLVFSMIGAVAIAADRKLVAKTEKTVAPAQQVEKKELNAIAKAFEDKGTKNCAARIDQITNFIGTNANTGAVLYFPASAPDKQMVSVSLEAVDKDKKSAYASTSFAPNGAGGCAAVYDAVAWFPESCENVASKQFAEKKISGKIKENISTIELDGGARVFLMPTKDGCISIKKELVTG